MNHPPSPDSGRTLHLGRAAPRRVVVITEAPLGSHRAHAINVFKTAGGLRRLGDDVVVCCRAPEDPAADPAHLLAEYGEPHLRVMLFPGDVPANPEQLSRVVGEWAGTQAAALTPDLVYARHFVGALRAAALGAPVVMETHAHIGDQRAVVREALTSTASPAGIRGVVTISDSLRTWYESLGAAPGSVHVVPDGVDLDLFTPPTDGIGQSPYATHPGPHVVYCGHLYDSKGIPTILEAARLKPEWRFHLVGGAPEDLARVRPLAALRRNVVVHGAVPHRDVPPFLWHADALLLPPSAFDCSARWTSPVKLAEYLASTRPVVASAIPGLLAWVASPAVRWFAPDHPHSLATQTAIAMRETPQSAAARHSAARAAAESFSYVNRARRIWGALQSASLLGIRAA